MASSSFVGASFVEELLTTTGGLRPDAAKAAIKNKLSGKSILLDSADYRTVALGELKKKRKKSVKTHAVPRKERRRLLLEATREVTYEQLQRQHARWREYAQSALAAAGSAVVKEDVHARAAQLDWHGASLRVLRSSSPSNAGAAGLVLAETRRMLLLLSATKRVWVPKAGTVVELELPSGGVAQCDAEKHGAAAAVD